MSRRQAGAATSRLFDYGEATVSKSRQAERRVFLVGLVASVAWGGCINAGSLSSGGPNDGGADSSVPANDGSPSSDGSPASDGSSASDVVSSDGGPGDGSPYPFCQKVTPTPTFCDDFDQTDAGTQTFPLWDSTYTNLGTVVRTGTTSVSGPNSMLAETTAIWAEADLLKSFPNCQRKGVVIKTSFDLYIQTVDSSSNGEMIAAELIFFNTGSQFNQISFNLDSLGSGTVSALVGENGQGPDGGLLTYQTHTITAKPVTGQWFNVEIDYSVPSCVETEDAGVCKGSSQNTVTVKFGQNTVLDSQPLALPIQGGVPTLHLGIGIAEPRTGTAATGIWNVYYDNFAATLVEVTDAGATCP
jgi:hypothetical protein